MLSDLLILTFDLQCTPHVLNSDKLILVLLILFLTPNPSFTLHFHTDKLFFGCVGANRGHPSDINLSVVHYIAHYTFYDAAWNGPCKLVEYKACSIAKSAQAWREEKWSIKDYIMLTFENSTFLWRSWTA